MNDTVIEVQGLCKKLGGRPVVQDVSMQVRRGEIFGFLGPNGSGKTTTMRMMCGLLKPDAGTGTCLGFDLLKDSESIKREIGYMPQRFSMWTDLTVQENLEFVARIFGVKNRKRRVEEALEQLGLQERANQLAGNLSGGWKQRVALGACLLHEPKLLLLDEPSAGLDPKARCELWDDLYTLANTGIAILVTTHYMDEATRCNRLVYILNGKLIAEGTPSEIIEKQKLFSFAVFGEELEPLSRKLLHAPGVEQTLILGNALHVVGTDQAVLEATLQRIAGPTHRIQPIPANLEDVFIHLMDLSGEDSEWGA